jgi:hypothetical protein
MPLAIVSPSVEPNPKLVEKKPERGEGNRKWLARLGEQGGVKLDENGIVLIGGTSVADFRVRVAQSAARHDMVPSFWSLCGILLEGGVFVTVPLDLRARDASSARRRRHNDDVSEIPKSNAVRTCSLDEYDDPKRYPNIAVVRYAKVHQKVHKHIRRVQMDRSIVDLAALMLPWLGFVWGTRGSTNPLSQGMGLPSAAFVETVFAMAGFELTPGLSSTSSCPEAMWQSAKWWSGFYEETSARLADDASATAVPMAPEGFFVTRQREAAIAD